MNMHCVIGGKIDSKSAWQAVEYFITILAELYSSVASFGYALKYFNKLCGSSVWKCVNKCTVFQI